MIKLTDFGQNIVFERKSKTGKLTINNMPKFNTRNRMPNCAKMCSVMWQCVEMHTRHENAFKYNNENSKSMSMILFCCPYSNILHTLFNVPVIVDEHAIILWDLLEIAI